MCEEEDEFAFDAKERFKLDSMVGYEAMAKP
jgi:hypothetical protein